MKMKHNIDYGRSPHVEKEPSQNVFTADKPGPNSVTIFELRENTCRWPCWDRGERRYCGEVTVRERPYCVKHYRRSYTPGPRQLVT